MLLRRLRYVCDLCINTWFSQHHVAVVPHLFCTYVVPLRVVVIAWPVLVSVVRFLFSTCLFGL